MQKKAEKKLWIMYPLCGEDVEKGKGNIMGKRFFPVTGVFI
jgi:hypothetical protein